MSSLLKTIIKCEAVGERTRSPHHGVPKGAWQPPRPLGFGSLDESLTVCISSYLTSHILVLWS